MKDRGKHTQKIKSKRVKIILVSILLIAIFSLIFYLYNSKNKSNSPFNNIDIDTSKITDQLTERMLQVEELKKQNEDIIGWIEIPNTNINFPVVQGTDNQYYMTHNYKKEDSKDGSIYLDKDYNWDLPSSNLLMYGHNNKNGNMFQGLLEYEKESYYREHSTIKFTTVAEDSEYEIISVFKSRVYYKSEKDVFRYYYFINAENEEEYNYYIEECKKASLYDIEKTATFGEQLLTLSTCEYSQEDGRFAIVARKIK